MVKEFKDWLFVKVPEDATDWVIKKWPDHDVLFFLDVEREPDWIELPPGSWQIIGKGDVIDWEGIAEKEDGHFKLYDSPNVDPYFNGLMENAGLKAVATSSAKSSGHSLLRSLGMEPGTTLILKKNEK